MRRYGAWVAILLLTLYLIFLGGGWQGIYNVWIRQITMVVTAAVFTVWFVVGWRRPEWRPRSVLTPAILAVLFSLAASTVTSRFPRQSVEYLGYAVLLAGLYLLLVKILADPFLRPRMGALAVALTAVLGIAYAAATVGRWLDWWAVVGRITVPPLRPGFEGLAFGNPSAVLTIVVLFLCSAAAALGFGSRGRLIIVGSLGLLAAFVIYVSGSRAGWFAVGVTILLVAALYVSSADRRHLVGARLRNILVSVQARVAVAALGLAGIAAVGLLGPVVIRRLGEGGEDLRFNYVLAALRMFGESPIFGTGPGTWVTQRVRYTYAPETDYYIPHAHNIYVQTLAELGLVGALAGVLLAGSLAWLVRDATCNPDALRRRWGWAAIVALVYFGAHQLLDFYPNMPAVLFAAALPVAWLDATAARRPVLLGRPAPAALAPPAALAGAAAITVAIIGLTLAERPAAIESQAVALANDGKWAAADPLATEAVRLDPAWPPYQLTMGLTAARVGDHTRATEAFREAALADDLPEAWLNLAAEETLLGQEDEAREALWRSARLGLQRPALAMAVGELASRLGEADLAVSAYSLAVSEVPSLAGDSWWQSEAERAAAFPAIIDRAIEVAAPIDRWQIALMAGDPGRARALAPSVAEVPGSATPADIIGAWQGDDAALGRIRAAVDARPLDTWSLMWAARLESRRGNVEAADRYRLWASIPAPGAGAGGAEMRVSDRELVGQDIHGGLAAFWGTYTYRRPTPWNMLVPSLIQLTFK